jgi:mannose-6-phosphate isomerase
MFVGITNTPRDYAWGSTTAIAELLGHPASGGPEAELWLGAHPGSPSVITEPALVDGAPTLVELTATDRLPFLLKVLAAASPLSLQAHPTMAQAQAGFERENTLGIPLDAAERNYKDSFHKPELIYALSESYRALCGFRPATATTSSIARLQGVRPGDAALAGWSARLASDDDIRSTFEWLVSRGDGVAELVEVVVSAAPELEGDHFTLVTELAAAYPGDPGIVISLMLNLVTLKPGEVLYLPAGNIHAYVEGLGIELMAASDNVLRGGLTPKHVDVPELLSVLDFTPVEVPYLAPIVAAPGVEVFRPDVDDFVLTVVTLSDSIADAALAIAGPAIAIATAGSVTLTAASGATVLTRGESVFLTAGDTITAASGSGTVFVASAGA